MGGPCAIPQIKKTKKGRRKCSLRLRGVSNVHFSQQTRAANSKHSTAASKQINPGGASPQRENSVLHRSLGKRYRGDRVSRTKSAVRLARVALTPILSGLLAVYKPKIFLLCTPL